MGLAGGRNTCKGGNGIGSGKELPNKEDINTLIKGIQDNNRVVETEKK